MDSETPLGGRTTRNDELKRKTDSIIIAFGQLQEGSLVSPRMFFVVEGDGENSRPTQNLERNTDEESNSSDHVSAGDRPLGRTRGSRLRT